AARGQLPNGTASDVDGILMIQERLDQGTVTQAFAVRAAVAGPAAGADGITLAAAIGLAIAGGLILNLMPCVLPVLSLKAIALVVHGQSHPSVVRRHGFAYTAGVLASFALLAGALIALRAGGAEIGWGFQLQSPLSSPLPPSFLFALRRTSPGRWGSGPGSRAWAMASRPAPAIAARSSRARSRRWRPPPARPPSWAWLSASRSASRRSSRSASSRRSDSGSLCRSSP